MKCHPVQLRAGSRAETGWVAAEVALRAYEVYKDLYAHSYPKAEWRARVEQAFRGMRMR